MPRIVQLNVTVNWGSTGKIAESIGIAIKKQGWESYIAYGRWSCTSQSKLIKVGENWDMYLHYFEQRIRDNEGLCSRRATKKLIQTLKTINPDIIHLHNIHDHWLNYKLLFEYLNDTEIKVVWTFHDFWPITGHCMHFISTNCLKYQSRCYDCPMRSQYPKAFIDASYRNYELKKRLFTANDNLIIVPVSEWVAEMTRLSFLKNKPIQVIYNGIDTEIFKPTSLDILDKKKYSCYLTAIKDKFVIMSVASQWKYDKGLDDYVKMSRMLNDDEVIVLVGLQDNMLNTLPSNIIGIRRTTNPQELAALYTRADVITILSSAETFGLTAVEGFACGTPAVVYNNTAPPSLISDEVGYVVSDKDYAAAYTAIQGVKKIGKSFYTDTCIKVARENYDIKICIEKYIQLYSKLI